MPDSELHVSSHIYRLCGLDTGTVPAAPGGPLYGLSLEGFLTALFLVGSQYEFTAEKPGRLMLGMWDSKHSDNAGKLDVVIRGTFEKK